MIENFFKFIIILNEFDGCNFKPWIRDVTKIFESQKLRRTQVRKSYRLRSWQILRRANVICVSLYLRKLVKELKERKIGERKESLWKKGELVKEGKERKAGERKERKESLWKKGKLVKESIASLPRSDRETS
jgi:hypothetical protein